MGCEYIEDVSSVFHKDTSLYVLGNGGNLHSYKNTDLQWRVQMILKSSVKF